MLQATTDKKILYLIVCAVKSDRENGLHQICTNLAVLHANAPGCTVSQQNAAHSENYTTTNRTQT